MNYGVVPDVGLYTICRWPCTHLLMVRAATDTATPSLESNIGSFTKAIGYRRSEHFRCWKFPAGRTPGIWGAATFRRSCRFGSKRAKESGLRTEAAVTGLIRAPEIGRWFTGILVQYQVLSNLTPGVELFHGTSQQAGQSAQTGFNLGMVWDLSDLEHIMFSAGPAFGGPNQLQGYFAYQLTFGPYP